jgi:hypothetical protein
MTGNLELCWANAKVLGKMLVMHAMLRRRCLIMVWKRPGAKMKDVRIKRKKAGFNLPFSLMLSELLGSGGRSGSFFVFLLGFFFSFFLGGRRGGSGRRRSRCRSHRSTSMAGSEGGSSEQSNNQGSDQVSHFAFP